MLDYIILFVSCVIEIYMCFDFLNAFLEVRNYKWHRMPLFIGCLCVILLYSLNLIGIADLNLIGSPIIIMFFVIGIYRASISQAIMNFLILFMALLGGEFVLVILAGVTSPSSTLNLADMPWLTFASKLLTYLMLVLIKQTSRKSKKKLSSNVFWMYLVLPFSSLGMMMTMYFLSEDAIANHGIKLALSISFAMMLIGNIIVFSAFNKYAEEVHKTMENEWIITKELMNKQYYNKVVEMNEERQRLIHDMKHYIRTFISLIDRKEYDEALELTNRLSTQVSKNEDRLISNVPVLDTILSERKKYAEDRAVSFEVNVEPTISLECIDKADYVVILGNVLENAMQAAEYCETDRFVKVNIFKSSNELFLVCKVVNSFNENFLKQEKGQFVSTKQESGVHGIGIKSVQKTVEKYGGMLNLTVKDNRFITVISIPISVE